MSDDELRALAREVEARPGDVAARRAYARALARAGDAEGEARELLALARAGDEAARAAVMGPWPVASGHGRARRAACAPVRAPGPARAFALPGDEYMPARLLVAEDLVLLAEPTFKVLDLRDGRASAWSQRYRGWWLRAGLQRPDRLIVGGERLEAVDPRTGLVQAGADLHGARHLRLDVDRALLVGRGGHLATLDLGDAFGEELWTRGVDGLIDALLAGPWVIATCGRNPATNRLEAFLADDGRSCAALPVSALDRHGVPWLCAADAQGIVVDVEDGPGEGSPRPRPPLTAELSLPDLGLRWSRAGLPRASALVALSSELALVPAAPWGIQAVERAMGATRWTAPCPPGATAVAIAGDVVYLAGIANDGLTLRAHDLATGARLFETPLAPGARSMQVDVAAFERGVAVHAADTLHLVREA